MVRDRVCRCPRLRCRFHLLHMANPNEANTASLEILGDLHHDPHDVSLGLVLERGLRSAHRYPLLTVSGYGHLDPLGEEDPTPLGSQAVSEALETASNLVCVEANATAQLATLIRAQTGLAVDRTILRYDGRPFSPEYIVRRAS